VHFIFQNINREVRVCWIQSRHSMSIRVVFIILAAYLSQVGAFLPSAVSHRIRPAAVASALSEREDIVRAKESLLGTRVPTRKWDIELFSPSKINLFLRIVRRRDDGFHDLASLFQAINLSDKLSMSLLPEDAEDDTFECDMEGVPVDRTNLVLRAVDIFRERTGNTRKFAIRLEKTVPAQAGLGGGSGNAATALWGCNELCKQHQQRGEGVVAMPACSEAELVDMSKHLGSDATFFLSQGTAYCTGRGEVVTPLAPLPRQGEGSAQTLVWVVKPFVGLSTPQVFKALDLDSRSTADPLSLLGLHTTGAEGSGLDKFVNDLEPPAFACVPDLARLKEKLEKGYGFPVVSMSGSGTSIFCMGQPASGGDGWQEELEADESFPWPIKVFRTAFLNRPEGEWYSAGE